MSNNLGPDQAQHFARSHLGSNWLKRLSADDTSRQEFKLHVLSCQQRVTTCFDYEVIRDLESIDHLFIDLSAG